MQPVPLNLKLSSEAKQLIQNCMEPEIVLGLFGQGYEWIICGYDKPWLEKNLEIIQSSGNPFFYQVEELTIAIQSMFHVEELKGKFIELKDGRLSRT